MPARIVGQAAHHDDLNVAVRLSHAAVRSQRLYGCTGAEHADEKMRACLVAERYLDQTRTVRSDSDFYGAGDVGNALDPKRGRPIEAASAAKSTGGLIRSRPVTRPRARAQCPWSFM